jgi:hypothetical protein
MKKDSKTISIETNRDNSNSGNIIQKILSNQLIWRDTYFGKLMIYKMRLTILNKNKK